MRTNFFYTNFLNTPRGPGHPGKIPGTSQILLFEPKEDKLSREGANFSATTPSRGRPPPPTPPGGLRTQKVDLCVQEILWNPWLQRLVVLKLSGMFRRSASLAIPHLKSFAAIPSMSLVQLGHTNRNVLGKKNGPVFRNVCVFEVSRAVGIARFESVSEPQPHRTIQCH